MMRSRSLLLGSCLLSLAGAFLVPLPSKPTSRLFSTLERQSDEKETPELGENITWDTKKQHQVNPGDWFILDGRVNDYSSMTEEEKENLPDVNSVDQQVTYQPFVPTEHPFAWARNLHTTIKTPDVVKTSKFYTEALGMIQVRDFRSPDVHSATLAYGSEEFGQNPALHFVESKSGADKGDGFLGATIIVEDVAATVSKVRSAGGKVVADTAEYNYPACAIPEEPASTVNKEVKATVQDPAGNQITLIQGHSDDKLSSVTLRVADMEKAVAFYNKLGMKILKMRSYEPYEKAASTWVGYDDDHVFCMGFVHEKMKEPNFHMFRIPRFSLELKHNFNSGAVRAGNGQEVAVGVEDVAAAMAHLKSSGAKVVSEAKADAQKVVVGRVQDVDGYTIALTDMGSFNEILE